MNYQQVKINLTQEHYQELQEEALGNGMSIAQLVRHKIGIDLKATPRSFQRSRKVRSDKKPVVKADPQLLYHLAKIGNNLNQITKHLNKTKVIDSVVINSIIEIQQEIKKL